MANGAPLSQSGNSLPQFNASKSPTSQDGTASQSDSSNAPHTSASTTPIASNLSDTAASSALSESRPKDNAVPAACLACRSKHLKCDGQTPCVRCLGSGSECVYVASRRGYKGPRRNPAQNPNKRQATSPPPQSGSGPASDCPMLLGAGVPVPSGSAQAQLSTAGMVPFTSPTQMPTLGAIPTQGDLQLYQSYFPQNPAGTSNLGQVPPTLRSLSVADRCLDSFYYNFHVSHPFVLPKPYLLSLSSEPALKPLLSAIRWVGSLFIEVAPARHGLFDEAYRLIYEPQRAIDGFLVQAMMLLIVALDGSCENDKARMILGDVESIALQIGLNNRAFATLNGRAMPVIEESWRRTWWDLFIIDGMVAGVHRVTNFLLYDVPADVALPCEEYQYMSGNIPQPMYLDDLENREFSGEEREFSSFAYRILCGRILGRFMRTPPIQGPDDENLARMEALLTNWRLHLPASKKDALQKDGRLDEMMFQAHMMNNATSIMLHQPFSQLDSSPVQKITSCAPYQLVPSGDLFNTHTRHTITAACTISSMITHRVPLLSHTHFFTCVITLSSIVHLSKWAVFFIRHDDDDLRQQIRLNIGALNHLAGIWGAADRALGQVRAVAQEIYSIKKQQQTDPQYWLGYSQEDMIQSVATDDSIIGEIENPDNASSAIVQTSSTPMM